MILNRTHHQVGQKKSEFYAFLRASCDELHGREILASLYGVNLDHQKRQMKLDIGESNIHTKTGIDLR